MADNRVNLAGKVFGKLTIKKRVYDRGIPKWSYICECGNEGMSMTCQFTKKNSPKRVCNKCSRRKPRKSKLECGVTTEFNNYKNGARVRGYVFELTRTDVKDLITKACSYCGKHPENRGRNNAPMNGVDRFNNEIGYTKLNCRSCCKMCNHMKRDYSYNDFVEHINRIIQYKEK